MARPLTPDTIWSIAGASSIVVVLGAMAYLYFSQATIPEIAAVSTQYSDTLVNSELSQAPDKNVFLQTAKLSRPVASVTGEAANYQPDELGKTNIYQPGL